MDRQVKFRGKRVDNGEWVYGNYCQSMASPNAIQELDYYGNCDGKLFEIDRKTLGQFTGLHDKNDKEIYEGDILKQAPYMCDDRLCFVEYDAEVGCGIGFYLRSSLNTTIGTDEWEDFEVVGNIFDNPELLGDQQ